MNAMKQRAWMKVSNSTPDNGGSSTLRVMFFSSLLAFGRSFLETAGSFVSRPSDIVVVGCKIGALAPRDVTFGHSKQKFIFPPLRLQTTNAPFRRLP